MAAIDESCDSNPNFAIICSFITKFGNDCGVQVTIPALQQMLEDTKNAVSEELKEIHIHLLRKGRKRVNKEKWEKSLIKFCHEYSSVDAWELERFGYKKAKLSVKIDILKRLLELQFDHNAKFKADVNKQDATVLRVLPIGRDIEGNMYWYQIDNDCNMRLYRQDGNDEQAWQLLCSSKDGLVDLLMSLGKQSVKGKDIISEILKSSSSVEKVPEDDNEDIKKGEVKDDLTATLLPNKPCAIIIKTEKKEPVMEDSRTMVSKSERKEEAVEESHLSPVLIVPEKSESSILSESEVRTVKQESDDVTTETKCPDSDVTKPVTTTLSNSSCTEIKKNVSDTSKSTEAHTVEDSSKPLSTSNVEEKCANVNLKISTIDSTSTKLSLSGDLPLPIGHQEQQPNNAPENFAISTNSETVKSSDISRSQEELKSSLEKCDRTSDLKPENRAHSVEPFPNLKFKGSKSKLYQKWSNEKKKLSFQHSASDQNVCDLSVKSPARAKTNFDLDNDVTKPIDLSSPTKESVPFKPVIAATCTEFPMDLSRPSLARSESVPNERLSDMPVNISQGPKRSDKNSANSRNVDLNSRTNTSKISHSTDSILSKPFKKKLHLIPEIGTDIYEQSRHSVICETKSSSKLLPDSSETGSSSAVISNIHPAHNNINSCSDNARDNISHKINLSTKSKIRPLSPKSQEIPDDLRHKKLRTSPDEDGSKVCESHSSDNQPVDASDKGCISNCQSKSGILVTNSSEYPQTVVKKSSSGKGMDLKVKKSRHEKKVMSKELVSHCLQNTDTDTVSAVVGTKTFSNIEKQSMSTTAILQTLANVPIPAEKVSLPSALIEPDIEAPHKPAGSKSCSKLSLCDNNQIESQTVAIPPIQAMPEATFVKHENPCKSATFGESKKTGEPKRKTLDAISEKLLAFKSKGADSKQISLKENLSGSQSSKSSGFPQSKLLTPVEQNELEVTKEDDNTGNSSDSKGINDVIASVSLKGQELISNNEIACDYSCASNVENIRSVVPAAKEECQLSKPAIAPSVIKDVWSRQFLDENLPPTVDDDDVQRQNRNVPSSKSSVSASKKKNTEAITIDYSDNQCDIAKSDDECSVIKDTIDDLCRQVETELKCITESLSKEDGDVAKKMELNEETEIVNMSKKGVDTGSLGSSQKLNQKVEVMESSSSDAEKKKLPITRVIEDKFTENSTTTSDTVVLKDQKGEKDNGEGDASSGKNMEKEIVLDVGLSVEGVKSAIDSTQSSTETYSKAIDSKDNETVVSNDKEVFIKETEEIKMRETKSIAKESEVNTTEIAAKIKEVEVKANETEVKANTIETETKEREAKVQEMEVKTKETKTKGKESDVKTKIIQVDSNETDEEIKQAKVETKGTKVDAEESIVETKESKVETKESKVETKETKVETKETKVETKETKVDAEESTVETKESKVKTNVETKEANVEAKEPKRKTNVETKVADVETRETEFETKKTEVEAKETEVEAKETEVEATETANETEVEAKETEVEAKEAAKETEVAAKESEVETKKTEVKTKDLVAAAKDTQVEAKETAVAAKITQVVMKETAKEIEVNAKEIEVKAKELKVKSKEAETEVKETEAEVKETEAEVKETEAEAKETDSEVKQTDSEVNETGSEVKKTEADVKETEVEMKETEAEIKETEAEMKETEAEMKETEAEMKKTEAEMKETEAEMKETEAEIKETETEIKETETEIKETEAEVKETKMEVNKTEVQAKEIEVRAKKMEAKLINCDDVAEEIDKKKIEIQLNEGEIEMEAEETEVKVEKNELKSKETEVKILESELKSKGKKVKTKETDVEMSETSKLDNKIDVVVSNQVISKSSNVTPVKIDAVLVEETASKLDFTNLELNEKHSDKTKCTAKNEYEGSGKLVTSNEVDPSVEIIKRKEVQSCVEVVKDSSIQELGVELQIDTIEKQTSHLSSESDEIVAERGEITRTGAEQLHIRTESNEIKKSESDVSTAVHKNIDSKAAIVQKHDTVSDVFCLNDTNMQKISKTKNLSQAVEVTIDGEINHEHSLKCNSAISDLDHAELSAEIKAIPLPLEKEKSVKNSDMEQDSHSSATHDDAAIVDDNLETKASLLSDDKTEENKLTPEVDNAEESSQKELQQSEQSKGEIAVQDKSVISDEDKCNKNTTSETSATHSASIGNGKETVGEKQDVDNSKKRVVVDEINKKPEPSESNKSRRNRKSRNFTKRKNSKRTTKMKMMDFDNDLNSESSDKVKLQDNLTKSKSSLVQSENKSENEVSEKMDIDYDVLDKQETPSGVGSVGDKVEGHKSVATSNKTAQENEKIDACTLNEAASEDQLSSTRRKRKRRGADRKLLDELCKVPSEPPLERRSVIPKETRSSAGKSVTNAFKFDYYDDDIVEIKPPTVEKVIEDEKLMRYSHLYSLCMPSLCRETKLRCEIDGLTCNNYGYKLKHTEWLESLSVTAPVIKKQVPKAKRGSAKKTRPKLELLQQEVEQTESPSVSSRRGGRGSRSRGRGKKAMKPVYDVAKSSPKVTPTRGRGKGNAASQRGRAGRGRTAAKQNNSDFHIPEGFLEILDNSKDKTSGDDEPLRTPSKGRKNKLEVSSQASSENECLASCRKRSRRIQDQHQKKMSELAVEMQNEHRRLEQLAKKNSTPGKKSSSKQKSEVVEKLIYEIPIIEDTIDDKPGGRKRRLRAVNTAKLALLYDEESKDSEQSTSRSTEKSRKRRGVRGKKRGYKPWDLSSGSSTTTIEEITEEEEEEEEPEEQLVFNANEDEFACEEVDEDDEPVIIRRARTAMKASEGENAKECIVDDKACSKCGKLDRPEWILLCDKCNDGYHTSCLVPELYNIPDGDWFCQPCEHLFLCQCLSVELHKLEALLKQKERDELRKQRLAYVGISLDNVLKPEKKESESVSEAESVEVKIKRVEVERSSDDEVRKKVYGKRSSRARRNVNYQFKEYDELIASAIGDDALDFKLEEFTEPAVEEKESEDDDSYKGPLPAKRKRVKKLNNLDFSDEDDSGDDYKGLSTDTEHTPSVNTGISMSGSDAASGEWRIVKARPKQKKRASRGGRRRQNKYSSSEEEEDLESDASEYRPTTRRAAQKQISYREVSSEEEWETAPKRPPKRKKKYTSSDTSEMSFRSDMSEKKPKKARGLSKWNGSSSESEEKSEESSESQAEDSESTRQSAGEWKIEKSTESGRIKINKKVIGSDSDNSAKKAKPKKRLNRVISDSEEEDEDESSSESSENSESEASSEDEDGDDDQPKKVEKKVDPSCRPKLDEPGQVKANPLLKAGTASTLAKDGKPKPKPKLSPKGPRIIVTDKSKAVVKPTSTSPKVQPEKPATVTPIRVAQLPSDVAAVCRAVANSHHVTSNQIVVQTVVVKTVPKGAIKEIKMVPSKIQYKDKIEGNEPETKKSVISSKEPPKQDSPLVPTKASPAVIKSPVVKAPPPVMKNIPPQRETAMPVSHGPPPPLQRPFLNAPGQHPNSMRQSMMPTKGNITPQSFPPSMMRPQNMNMMPQPHSFRGIHSPRFPNAAMDMQSRPLPQPPQSVRNSIPPHMYPGSPDVRSNHPMKAMPLRANALPPSAYSSPPLELINSPIRPPSLKNAPQPYSGSIVEPFSSADMDQGSDSREEVPLERIPCEPENVSAPPYMGKSVPYEKENEYRPAKEAANYPYSMTEEKGFSSTYSPLSSLQEFTSRPSPLKPSLVETFPSSSSPTRLTPLDSYPQSSSPKGFISLDSYRKRNTFGNEGETRPMPPSDSYQAEARFAQETFPPSPSVQNPGTPPRLYSQFPDTYSSSRSPEFYQGQQYYPAEEGMSRANFQSGYNPPEQVSQYSYTPNSMQQPNDGFMIDTILRARNDEDELSNVSGIVQYITQQ